MFIVYDKATGDIGHTISGPDKNYEKTLQARGHSWLVDPTFTGEIWNHYVSNGRIIPRPEFNITMAGAAFSGIPAGTKVVVSVPNGGVVGEGVVDDGVFDLDAPAGQYVVEFSQSPYRPVRYDAVIP